jgi:dolichol-phosphate mannosyltransferase
MYTASIVIPCYNEEKTLRNTVNRVLEIKDDTLALELIIVDDCSQDKSLEIARQLAEEIPEVSVQNHEVNKGKGAALRTGFQKANGDCIAVQDADLEYDPWDLRKLIQLLLEDKADVAMGSRFLTGGPHRVLYFWHSVGNQFLTLLSNMMSNLNLTDMEVCYKVFRREVIQSLALKENRFGFEPEVTARLARYRKPDGSRLKIFEVGISYAGRTYEEGKKIGWRDGVRAIWCIFRYNLFAD